MNRYRYKGLSEIPLDLCPGATRRDRPLAGRGRRAEDVSLQLPARSRIPSTLSTAPCWPARVRRREPPTPSAHSSGGASDRPQRDRTPVLGRIRRSLPARNVRVQAMRCAALPVRGQVRCPLRLAFVRPRDPGGGSSASGRGWGARGDPVRPVWGPPRPRVRGRAFHTPEHPALRQLHLPPFSAKVSL